MRRIAAALCLVLLALLPPSSGWAEPDRIVVGLQSEPNAVDPHFSASGTNQALSMHIFDTLLTRDAQLRFMPALATAVRRVDPVTWEFDLRQGVRFHDGRPFTAEDVVFSLTRAPRVPFSPASYAGRVAQIREAVAVGPHRVRIVTKKPFPQLLIDISTIYIVPASLGLDVATDAFNDGRAAIGTGPYRFVSWAHGDRIDLARNPDYWGPAPAFARATLRFIPNDSARVAALVAGNVDAIDAVPPADIGWLRTRPSVDLWQAPTVTLLYLHMDSDRATSPFVEPAAGPAPGPFNPLRDARVRRAVSLAIDRPLLVEKVLSGAGVPANQMVPAGTVGHDPDLPPLAHDPVEARRLLAEAGLPDGFRVTLHASNNRYVNDGLVAQAVAAMLSRVGLAVRVETLPRNVFLSRATRLEFSFLQYGFGATTGTALQAIKSVAGTFDPARGSGSNNRGRYSNPALDAAIAQAETADDPTESEAALRAAADLLTADMGIVPLYHQVATWATRPGLVLEPRRDERTLAHGIRPSGPTVTGSAR